MLTKTGHKRPTLADVDGTVPGKAMLMSVKLDEDEPGQMCTIFVEEPDAPADPWTWAEGLMRGIEDDWPDHEWAIVGNWRARYLRWAYTMQSVIPGEHTPDEYVAMFKEHRG